MRLILPLLIFDLGAGSPALGQTYTPGQTPAARGLQQQQLWTQQQSLLQLQRQQNVMAGQPPVDPGRQARIDGDQARLRAQRQANLSAQRQLQPRAGPSPPLAPSPNSAP